MSTLLTPMRPAERHIFFNGPLVVLIAFVLIDLFFPGTSDLYAGWPIVISVFFVGMPHGAADLAVNSQLTRSRTVRKQLVRFAGYLVMLAASLAFFLLSPHLALILFVVTSGLHFGLADARDLERRHTGTKRPRLTLMSALARGCLVLGLPFLVSPSESLIVFADIIALTGQSVVAIETWSIRMVAGVAVFAATLTQCGVAIVRWRESQAAIAGLELLEAGAISLSFLYLHPLFAIGLYVLAWHSWRHMYSLTRFLPSMKSDGSCKSLMRSMFHLHVESLPLLIPTVVVFGGLAWWRLDVWSSELLAALTVAFFAVVTLPHHLLIERLSRHGESGGAERDGSRFPITASTFSMPPQLTVAGVRFPATKSKYWLN